MSQVRIRIPMPLRTYTNGADEVLVEANTVRDALAASGRFCPIVTALSDTGERYSSTGMWRRSSCQEAALQGA